MKLQYHTDNTMHHAFECPVCERPLPERHDRRRPSSHSAKIQTTRRLPGSWSTAAR
jgi:hypothetical protein